uniref:Uncharacterized protein n=1 Tax=Panagrolaimus sp. ES5 TaxID=591445 RepID=A0AC34F5Q5_9BILA
MEATNMIKPITTKFTTEFIKIRIKRLKIKINPPAIWVASLMETFLKHKISGSSIEGGDILGAVLRF